MILRIGLSLCCAGEMTHPTEARRAGSCTRTQTLRRLESTRQADRGPAREALQRAGQMRLIVVAGRAHHIGDRAALLQERRGRSGAFNLADGGVTQPGRMEEMMLD